MSGGSLPSIGRGRVKCNVKAGRYINMDGESCSGAGAARDQLGSALRHTKYMSVRKARAQGHIWATELGATYLPGHGAGQELNIRCRPRTTLTGAGRARSAHNGRRA